MEVFALDNVYRNRYQEYYFADGVVADSREKYWRLLEWDRVVAVVTYIREKKYLTHCKHSDFKFFVVYRWGGQEWREGTRHKVQEWAVGWSNGELSFMTDIHFKTGEIVRQYVVPNTEIAGLIHHTCGGTWHSKRLV
ncbi:MAG: hypothetical protein WC907_04710 [Acholeplasmataceae bacterium]